MCIHLAGGTALDFLKLRKKFGWKARWFGCTEGELIGAGLHRSRAARLLTFADRRAEREEFRRCAELGVRLVSWRHTGYPAPLRHLPQPPIVIGALGRWPVPGRSVAIVGSRAATAYGRQSTLRLAGAAARAGFAVVSGLARGVDRAALEAALAEGGWPVAVLGCGLDVVYPPEHAELQRAIAARGTLVSEFPLGQRPDRHAFPRRNRVIAALSQAVLVVEAGPRSGALITVDHALEIGRDVLAVPGPIDAETSQGTNRLIFDGAQPVLDEAGLLHLLGAPPPAVTVEPAGAATGQDGSEAVLAALSRRVLALDELAAAARLDVGRVRAALITLELEGRIRRLDGGRFARRIAGD
jgi:DNA processing protein